MDLEGDSPWGAQSTPKPSESQTVTSPTPRGGGRASRTPKRYGTQPTRLEAVDDSMGPLGPLGDNVEAFPAVDEPPAPPQKEQAAVRAQQPSASASGTSSLRTMMDSVHLEDEDDSSRPKQPPPVQPPASANGAAQRQTQPSMSVLEAARPTFSINVGDPHKVGDLTSSHTEYAVRTKTTSKAYRTPEFTVSRRYRDFLWLYTQLHNNNPGVVVPPPPEKQAMGRFDADFVESRRQALERMLNKTAAHPILQNDGDLKLFLESDAFNVDVKNKERKDPMLNESKSMFSSIGIGAGSGGKFVEHDDWFHDRKVYLDALENQLRALLKATDIVVTQRKTLAESCAEFSASLRSLAAVELSPSLSGPLDGLSDIQLRIQELYQRQAQQDVLTIGIVVDEYIRLIGSVKQAFNQRQKAYHAWHAAESELLKRKNAQDKLLRQGRSQQDKISQISAEVGDAERKVHQARLLFEDMGRLMRGELERFEREKVEDFKSGVETFLEGGVEAQKELIELWETYLMQLDAEDDEHPFGLASPPAGIIAAQAEAGKDSTILERPPTSSTAESDDTEVRAAAIATQGAEE
ncbi:vacuolar protein sorting-associated protein-like protein vps5 [Rhizodiscina lignyota]|uniref:Vacuolar protein sorting-associated protein-like protein vps5 n=1 Tax=Rhizodiscina lignyota TaxID=1504668 RepID=A0A9P4M3S7_9PEZI|nr:vacuolar protein sorting-associated protein-like protein vps5 [Rhizodiscina lignyota]